MPTGIAYLDDVNGKTWNPIAMRCTPCSPGCLNCWHIRFAKRHAGNPVHCAAKRNAYAGGMPYLDERILYAPLSRQKPTVYAVEFMGDLFHTTIPPDMLAQVFDSMSAYCCTKENYWRHKYLVLTKRIDSVALRLQAADFILSNYFPGDCAWNMEIEELPAGQLLPANVGLGVSICNQDEADAKIPVLLSIPAAMHWISVEPMLGEIDIGMNKATCLPALDWVVCGGEKAQKPRTMNLDWARRLRDQCLEAGVPFFMKQESGRNNRECEVWDDDLMVRQLPEWLTKGD